MKYYFKYAAYIYLIVAAVFLYDAYSSFQKNETYWLSVALASVAIILFGFKRKFAKKFEDRNSK